MDRGVVRVYLGAAPGVGTTFAMLAEGRRRAARGADVVVGAVDTHGRGRTGALLEGIEQVPGADGVVDVETVLQRAPRVVLVDDLAGVGGPRHEPGSRWRDVERLAAAGIDVVSTLWVGHIESQRDVVERITGRTQEASVPDSFLANVAQVELVDMTPEALRRRLAHGNIYAPDQIDSSVWRCSPVREMSGSWRPRRVGRSRSTRTTAWRSSWDHVPSWCSSVHRSGPTTCGC